MEYNPLKPQKKTNGSKKIEPLVTKEAESFKKETSKITNWTNHKRLDEYFKKEAEPE